jgi:hypothetical protein
MTDEQLILVLQNVVVGEYVDSAVAAWALATVQRRKDVSHAKV